jgi:hypothetical protein
VHGNAVLPKHIRVRVDDGGLSKGVGDIRLDGFL